jgi:hypothetical protein
MKFKKEWAQVQEEHIWEDTEEWRRLSYKTTTMVKISIQDIIIVIIIIIAILIWKL